MKRRTFFTSLVVLASVLLAIAGAWKLLERQHWLSVVPSRLGIERILYVAEDSWGFGPGGNETGVIVYELSPAMAESIAARGMTGIAGPDGPIDWRQTPLNGPKVWFEGEGALPQTGPVLAPRLYNYLNRYGFGIPVDPAIMADIDHALIEAGNYYAHTRSGVFLVMPKARRVVFAFAG